MYGVCLLRETSLYHSFVDLMVVLEIVNSSVEIKAPPLLKRWLQISELESTLAGESAYKQGIQIKIANDISEQTQMG